MLRLVFVIELIKEKLQEVENLFYSLLIQIPNEIVNLPVEILKMSI